MEKATCRASPGSPREREAPGGNALAVLYPPPRLLLVPPIDQIQVEAGEPESLSPWSVWATPQQSTVGKGRSRCQGTSGIQVMLTPAGFWLQGDAAEAVHVRAPMCPRAPRWPLRAVNGVLVSRRCCNKLHQLDGLTQQALMFLQF